MNSVPHKGRLVPAILALVALAALTGTAGAQSLSDLNSQLSDLSSQINSALSNTTTAADVISKLDKAESTFATLAENPKSDRGDLLSTYSRLEEMLSRMYTTYKQKKDDCIAQISNGAQCDYDQPEQLSLQALYPLSWLHFQGAVLYSSDPGQAQKLLNEAIDGFTESTLVIVAPELVRENLLGRAYCERELGKYDKSEYEKAVADFKQIMDDGPNTHQYRPAQQGLATTYAAMGEMDKAADITKKLVQGAPGGSQNMGMEMFRLQQLFKAESATSDAAKRADYHKQAVDFMKTRENDKNGWAIVVAAVSQYVHDPVAEFSHSTDPFEQWLLANVLYSKKQQVDSAKYYLAAARSGKYPKAYKFAADIYYSQRRFDLVEQLVTELSHQPNNPDAQWAAYMRFKLPRLQWEQSGMKNATFEAQWVAAAQDFLKSYPRGEYSYEPRFRIAERLQQNKQYLDAAKEYSQVTGNTDYQYTAKFNAAECSYLALVAATNAAGNKNAPAPAVDIEALKNTTIADLDEAIKMEPAAERSAPANQRNFVRQTKGRAIYMLASLLEREHQIDYPRIAGLLGGYESQYPSMSERFDEIAEWRITALDQLGKYADLGSDVKALLERTGCIGAAGDFIKEIGLDFWKSRATKLGQGDAAGAAADAQLTATTYTCFEQQVQAGKIPAKNLTGTLSILGQAYIAAGDVDAAGAIFDQVVKADPGSPDANAGLARIAQAKKDYKNAVELWTRVEQVAAESDDQWYEAKYNVAVIYAAQGNIKGACDKLAVTRSEHPSLGTPEMKTQWDALQRKICLNRTASGG
jgi:tetratricopeptide (TPR) repeat protein